jgi:transglutaminase-like putative cysteine protease
MRYTPDAEAHGAFPLEDVLYAPDDLLAQIDAQGYAEGDCDDYVILLGALCVALSIPCQIEVLSTRDDRMFDHVYLRLVDDTVMDAIPSGPAPIGAGEPFGWEVPPERVTNRGVFPLLH